MVNYIIGSKKRFLSGISVTNQLILINIFFYIVSFFILSRYGVDFFYNMFALTPQVVLSGSNLWAFLTSMFLHSPNNFFHIFANMFSLFFIGNFLEKIIGRIRFIWVYLISGLIGGLFFVVSGLIFSNNLPGIGASGAIFGLLGVLAVLVPHSRIYLIVGPLIVLVFIAILGPYFSWIYFVGNILILIMIFSLLSFNSSLRKLSVPVELPMWILPVVAIVPLVIIGFFIVALPIGNSAHIGGLVVGLFYGFYLRKKFPRKTNMLRKHFK